MQTDRAQRVAEIVEVALESEFEDYASYLDEVCAGDSSLRAEVESLLKFRSKANDFIETPAFATHAESLVAGETSLKEGDQLGEYKIVSLLGEGGMGEVYLAEDTALGRTVAIKLVKVGFGSKNLLRHFRREERILAALTHPNIARLYGAAADLSGTPYFIMEYVDGQRLDDYCDQQKLNLTERLALFRKVCAAVTYAHQHLVIHRDLKPSNIRVNADGEPKLLDFGIAKLLDPDTEEMGQTITLQSVMTPEYASPEQVRGENMTTASDVYSLGVILYELLTGQRPYRISSRRPSEIARAIIEQKPTRPSTAFLSATSNSSGNERSTIIDQRLLRGDLDNIILMALRKEPGRRYAAVAQFSNDLQRYLGGLPVVARKDTVTYRTQKFVRRHKAGVAATALVTIALVVGLIVALWQAENARSQRDLAERERLKAQQINAFLQDMLGAAAPEVKGYEIKVADVLNEASRRARGQAAAQPDIMAEVLITLGRTYISIGVYAPAIEDLRAACDASLKANGELHSTTATALGWLGLALAYQDKFAEGESVSRKAIELNRKLRPEGSADLGVALYSLGMNLLIKGDAKGAESPLSEAAPLIKKYFGENHGYYMASLTALALVREKLGNIDGARALYRRSLDLGEKVDARYRIFVAQASAYLGTLSRDQGNYAEAEAMLRKSESVYREVLGEQNSNIPDIAEHLGALYLLQGKLAEAEREFRRALELLPKYFPREHNLIVSTKALLGLTLTRSGRSGEAEPLLREALETRKKTLAAGSPLIPLTESALGECLTARKLYAEAEPLLTRGYDGLKSKFGEKDRRVVEARQRLATFYETQGKSNEAMKLK